MTGWTCPKCQRKFTRQNQRHACGTGERADVLRNRPAELVKLYASLEKFIKTLGEVEFVTRDRYVLFRTKRIFADLVVMTDALRLAIHLPQPVEHELFFKVIADRKHVSHVAKLHTPTELDAMKPLLREAYDYSCSF